MQVQLRDVRARARLAQAPVVCGLKNVDFPLKNVDFLLKNVEFLLKNVEFLLKNVEFLLKNVDIPNNNRTDVALGAEVPRRVTSGKRPESQVGSMKTIICSLFWTDLGEFGTEFGLF